jgi:SNF2 family DNA or RNA helicase
MNFPFTPDDIEQPQKRAHRIGQKRSVNVYYTIVKNSIDEHIYDLIIDKSTDINSVLDKGKKGVVHYGNVENKVFNKLISQYAKDNNLEAIVDSKFTEV